MVDLWYLLKADENREMTQLAYKTTTIELERYLILTYD